MLENMRYTNFVKYKDEMVVWNGKKVGCVIEYTPGNMENVRYARFSRPPGTRSIILSPDDKILLSKEFRYETGGVEYRLPGGKVYDTFEEWKEAEAKGKDIKEAAIEGAKREIRQEVALEPKDPKIFKVVTSGGPTVEWDLFYLVVTQYDQLPKQELEAGEEITFDWFPFSEVIGKCLNGEIAEARSALVLLQYLYTQKGFRVELV